MTEQVAGLGVLAELGVIANAVAALHRLLAPEPGSTTAASASARTCSTARMAAAKPAA